jgi:hypothetical protein
MLTWTKKHARFTPEMLGFIPSFLSETDPRPAREQLNTASIYKRRVGWRPFEGFLMLTNGNLKYPGEKPTRLLAEAKLRDETVRFYEFALIAIVQPSGEFEVSRVD